MTFKSSEYIKFFHQDTNRTFPIPTIDHMSRIVGLSTTTNDDSGPPVLLSNLQDMLAAGAVADYLKASVFYNKEKDPDATYKELVDGIQEDAPLTISDKTVSILHGLMGISSETGELASAVLKGWSNAHNYDEINIKEEIGDILVYAALIANQFDFTLEDAMEANIAKRARRFPNGFTEFDAVNRDHEAERLILEASGQVQE